MPLFRKLPVVIEARQFTLEVAADRKKWIELAKWCGSLITYSVPNTPEGRGMIIETPEGSMEATIGDWIIKGVKGEFYPCKPDIFAQTHEEA